MRHAVACLILCLSLPGLALGAEPELDEAPIRSALTRLAPQLQIERIAPAPLAGLAEVSAGGQVYYVSLDGRHLLHGSLLRTADGVDLTEIRRSALRAAAIDALPLDARIRYAPKSPAEHRVTVFTAVDCGYCRRFHADIEGYLAAGIAVDYVMIPLAGPGSPAETLSRRVYCASDRLGAFTAATHGTAFEAPDCDSAYPQGVELAKRLGFGTTPTIVAEDGRVLGGYLDPTQLKQRLTAGR
ncbi:DsbC family protein [Pseudomarimonas salicorniae]|uniref:Thiol:disulfide interchange protein n=1 Tax=Pseudomarimonas salicorniae TaxID=2933270 RepID=A0ABT0GH09_9GAMM|nr:DsbC family protein [Lysobacter sp. CAU 1642]MCK7593310.1 DsbC family protein [Lysobacter sp. CAU 1642]